ncbi:hypothetical protein KC343_g1146 [Hortaea werneckii]|nr:hypothetical protein KC352_g2641 [Hortaea werneckii]KAI7569426.1 hypothetical protein KC317_g3344 [Hortaea werneckii]KAI7625786.1 hypothetical protein KC346_g1583 [Hortaea werneckii]KAI7636670.1 hypothetical protein KC343_g1146 [Hortaea werneckii]KAI7681801.1 hypothetical protein KC319_g1367 [Hortaea werneckii]
MEIEELEAWVGGSADVRFCPEANEVVGWDCDKVSVRFAAEVDDGLATALDPEVDEMDASGTDDVEFRPEDDEPEVRVLDELEVDGSVIGSSDVVFCIEVDVLERCEGEYSKVAFEPVEVGSCPPDDGAEVRGGATVDVDEVSGCRLVELDAVGCTLDIDDRLTPELIEAGRVEDCTLDVRLNIELVGIGVVDDDPLSEVDVRFGIEVTEADTVGASVSDEFNEDEEIEGSAVDELDDIEDVEEERIDEFDNVPEVGGDPDDEVEDIEDCGPEKSAELESEAVDEFAEREGCSPDAADEVGGGAVEVLNKLEGCSPDEAAEVRGGTIDEFAELEVWLP